MVCNFPLKTVTPVDASLEFAEFTSAQERIALGKKSQKLEAEKQQESMKDMIADA
jgi:GC-rich sequence DNA-binding factor